MFDPTIFENLRVVLEGAAYDLDLEGEALITGRSDLVNLSTMSRHFSIKMSRRTAGRDMKTSLISLPGRSEAEINLASGLEDWAGEKLSTEPSSRPGCEIWVDFFAAISSDEVCGQIGHLLNRLWGEDVFIRLLVSYDLSEPGNRRLTATVLFQRKIDEHQIDDLPELVDHVFRTLQELDKFLAEEM